MTVVLAAAVGIIVGVIFETFGLPVPAPPTWAGVTGVAGIAVGGMIVRWWK